MAKRGPLPMPESEWLKIKQFQKEGCKAAFTARMTGWSQKVVGRAYKSKTYDEYTQSSSSKKASKDKSDKEINDNSTAERECFMDLGSQLYEELGLMMEHWEKARKLAYEIRSGCAVKDDDYYLNRLYETFGASDVEVMN